MATSAEPEASDIDRYRATLRAHLPRLQAEKAVSSLQLFGSCVRGTAGPESDLDILVEFDKPPSFFRFIDLELELSALLGRRVDLVLRDALKPSIGERILGEAILV